ncbi:MAG: ATP-binding protein [Pseudomonadota bacterium]
MKTDKNITEGHVHRPPSNALLAFQTEFEASQLKVREALINLRSALQTDGFDEDTAGSVEIVAAEALNNVAEHAYCGAEAGLVKLTAHFDRSLLYLSIFDEGRPMPGDRLPERSDPMANVEAGDLPEGGFGWNIIRDLCDDIQYLRLNDGNHLLIRFAHHKTPNSGVL